MLSSDIKFYKAVTINDTASNGGLLSAQAYTSNAAANMFPNVQKAEIDSGSTKYRKMHIKNSNALEEALLSPKVWLDSPTPADDWITFFAATESDTQANITGTEQKYGSAFVSVDAIAGTYVIVVEVEDSSLTGIFADGMNIRLSDMTNALTPLSGNEEFHVIDGTPTVSGNAVTITTTTPLTYTYSVGNSVVNGILTTPTLLATVTDWVESGTGSYDGATYPVTVNNVGTIAQTWTLRFSSPTAFTVTGNTVGLLGTGSVSANFTPINSNFSKPYFILSALGFAGTWSTGNTITFKTHPSATAIWVKRVIPAGVTAYSTNNCIFIIDGEA